MSDRLPVALAKMISEPAFQRFESLRQQPNFFRAVGRTHTERWHSAFLGWLLDPEGSHGLGGFSLKRFIVAVANAPVGPEASGAPLLSPNELAHLAVTRDFGEATSLPNERVHQEKRIGDFRIDVWLEVEASDAGTNALLAIVELKVDAGLGHEQSQKYADYLVSEALRMNASALLVFIARNDEISESSSTTVGDQRWYCLGYQDLHDQVLIPCLEHPQLSMHMRPLIEHYILNMRTNDRGRGVMATTQEERTLALEIYERHRDTFEALASLLAEEDGFPEALIPDAADKESVSLRVTVVGGSTIEAGTVPEFLARVFDYAYKSHRATPSFPVSTSKKRYLIAEAPVHPTGLSFVNPKAYTMPDGTEVFFEANRDRPRAMAAAVKFLQSVGVSAS